MQVKITISLLSCLLFLSCYGTVSEVEPDNNQRKKAQIVKSDQTFEGSYYSAKGRDIDYLYLPVEKGHMIRGSLSGVKGIDGIVSMYRYDKKTPFKIISDSLSSLGEEFGPIWIEPPGVIITIQPKRNVNQPEYQELYYTFTPNIFAPSTPIEYEPNDTLETAQEIENQHMLGYYSNVFATPKRLERDFFYFDIKEKKKFSVNVKLSGVQGIDTIMRVFSKNYEKLKVIDEKAIGQGENLLSYGVQGPSRLYLGINSKDHKINPNQYYEIEITKSEYQSKNELEPNDTLNRASILKEDETSGEISDRHDVDYYSYKNENRWPVQLSLRIVPEDNLNPRLEFIRRKKSKILFDDGGKDEDEGLSNRIIAAKENIYIKIFTLDWEGSDSLPYKIILQAKQLVDNVEKEPNNKRIYANDVIPDSSVVGYINPNLDVDYFRLKTRKQDKFKILLDGIPDCRLSLSIADKLGYVSRNRVSKSMGDGISLTGIIEPDGLIILQCKRSKDNLFAAPYNMSIQSRKNWSKN